jgi:hypothetical protein
VPQIFPPYANSFLRFAIATILLSVAGGAYALYAAVWSPYATRQSVRREQPVPFSHEHHVGGLGLDCRYCHTTVETAASAGFPPTQTCMNCHAYVWTNAAVLEPVRRSWRERRPLAWQRVYDLPDFVFFDHAIHVRKGVGCETCHGRVDRMAVIEQEPTLYMKWCLACHEHPERYVRPREQVFAMGYAPAGKQEDVGRELLQRYTVRSDITECDTCHR